jgi:hypothetical protein
MAMTRGVHLTTAPARGAEITTRSYHARVERRLHSGDQPYLDLAEHHERPPVPQRDLTAFSAVILKVYSA